MLNIILRIASIIYKIFIICIKYIYYILLLCIINLLNCNILEVKNPIFNHKNPVHIASFEASGSYGDRFSKILREAIFNHLIEKGYAVGIQRDISVEKTELIIPGSPIELFEREASRPLFRNQISPREVGLFTVDTKTLILHGTLFTAREQFSESYEILLYLTLHSSKGDVLQTITLNQKEISLSKLNYIGKEISEIISNFITAEMHNESK
jgi:hypothetical protein